MGKDQSDDQVASMKEAFTLFDTDGDGRIATSELGILMQSMGGNPTQAQLKDIIAQEKLTSPFDFPRFLELMKKHMKAEPFDRQLSNAFKVLDKESTGYVSVSELRHILTSIGEKLDTADTSWMSLSLLQILLKVSIHQLCLRRQLWNGLLDSYGGGGATACFSRAATFVPQRSTSS